VRAIGFIAALALVVGCTTSGGNRGAGGGGDAAAAPTVADVIALELKRPPVAQLEPFLRADAPAPVRIHAARAVSRLERLDAWPVLKRLSADASVEIRVEAIFGLGQLDLALTAGDPAHDEIRAAIEALLIERLMSDTAAPVRGAVIRALGRVGRGPGVQNLVVLARGTGADRVDALVALGVNGARAKSTHQDDVALLVAVDQALKAADPRLRRAAAYTAFRQKLPISDERLAEAAKDQDPQVRIHVVRAMGEVASKASTPAGLLADPDWRVRVEAIRAAGSVARRSEVLSVARVTQAGRSAAKRIASSPGTQGHEAHVVREACGFLGDPEIAVSPPEAASAAELVHNLLVPTGAPANAARCACAVAVDALRGDADLVKKCAPDWPAARQRKLEVEVLRRLRLSSREKVVLISAHLSDASPIVRASAAWAIAGEGTSHAARAAAARLDAEEDSAVAAALLTLFAKEENAELLDDAVLGRVVQRFSSAKNLEEAEALLEAAQRLHGRTSPAAASARALLQSHSEPRVRDALASVSVGDRAPGARARTQAPPALKDMPIAATLKTDRGDVRIEFERELAPVAVNNFVTLARSGYFDGVRFHRVIGDFVAQGGDPVGHGSGGPGYTIPCENHDQPYKRGAIGMALAGKDTGGSQFFLTHSEQPHLDGRYTIFARVVDGWAAMDAIQPEDRLLGVDFVGAVPAR
jgi:cyclophilin family peptidyl-prolyl cis-trans isomerase